MDNIEAKDYDEFEYCCTTEEKDCNCECHTDEYDVCNWCAEEDCSGCGEFEFELEEDE